TIDLIGIDVVGRDHTGRHDVFEEAAPLIAGDDQYRLVPLGSVSDSMEYLLDKRFATSHIGVRVIIVSGAIVQQGVDRVHEGNCRQEAQRRLGQKLIIGRGDRNVFRSPKRQKRKIVEIVSNVYVSRL